MSDIIEERRNKVRKQNEEAYQAFKVSLGWYLDHEDLVIHKITRVLQKTSHAYVHFMLEDGRALKLHVRDVVDNKPPLFLNEGDAHRFLVDHTSFVVAGLTAESAGLAARMMQVKMNYSKSLKWLADNRGEFF